MANNPFIKILLLPLSFIYGIVVFIRNRLFDIGIFTSKEFNIPIISIGNITAGGTGKTPVTEYITELLNNEYKVAVLSRGYKRKTRGFLLADIDSTPSEIGDEPCQIKNRYPDIIVSVCENRVKGIENLILLHPETDVILLDDAYQHRWVKPGLSILLVDYNNPVTKDFLLPAGRLRESVSEMNRANIILVTKCPEKLKPIERRIMLKELDLPPFQHLFFTSLEYGSLKPVFPDYKETYPQLIKETRPEIILLTGIANPRPLKRFARSISPKIIDMMYPDHHNYNDSDIQTLTEKFNSISNSDKIVLTTWKDAVRLKDLQNIPEEIKKAMFFVPVKVYFLNDDTLKFETQIKNYVKSNKRNSILHKGKNGF